MSSGGSIPENFASDGDKRRAKLAFDIFNAFTKPEERQQLLPRAAGIEGEKVPVVKEVERQQLGRKLESLVVARLSLSYTDNGLALPRDFSKGAKQMLVGTIEARLGALKDAGVNLAIDPAEFARFRSTVEISALAAPSVPAPAQALAPVQAREPTSKASAAAAAAAAVAAVESAFVSAPGQGQPVARTAVPGPVTGTGKRRALPAEHENPSKKPK